MFEKDAEEYAEKVYGSSTEIDHYGIADAFKDGVEFGYNKAKAESEDQIKQIEKVSDYNVDQLAKAKDIIQQFLIQNPISDWLIEKAERFSKGE